MSDLVNIEDLMWKYDDPFFGAPRQGLSIRMPGYEICVQALAAYTMRRSGNRLSIYDGGKLIIDMEVRLNVDG